MQGILAGVILSIGRIVGETAALIFTSGTATGLPDSLLDSGRTLSIHMWMLSNEGMYINETYATAVVLLILVVGINALSKVLANKASVR
jgi:phosphate transport system permease protein